MTFKEYQESAAKVPLSLRNNRDRVDLPVLGLQEEAGKVGSLFTTAFASGRLALTSKQREDLQERLSHVLWSVALLCVEAGITMEDLATHSLAQLSAMAKDLDPEQR